MKVIVALTICLFCRVSLIGQSQNETYKKALLKKVNDIAWDTIDYKIILENKIFKSKDEVDTNFLTYRKIRNLEKYNLSIYKGYATNLNKLNQYETFYFKNKKLLFYSLEQIFLYTDSITKQIDTIGYNLELCYYQNGKVAHEISTGHGVTETDDFNATQYGKMRFRRLKSLALKFGKVIK
jgi:hypothetical protein